jgi:hypothetical protein
VAFVRRCIERHLSPVLTGGAFYRKPHCSCSHNPRRLDCDGIPFFWDLGSAASLWRSFSLVFPPILFGLTLHSRRQLTRLPFACELLRFSDLLAGLAADPPRAAAHLQMGPARAERWGGGLARQSWAISGLGSSRQSAFVCGVRQIFPPSPFLDMPEVQPLGM